MTTPIRSNIQTTSVGVAALTATIAAYAVGTGDDKILEVKIALERNPATTISSVTHNGVSLTQRVHKEHTGGQNTVDIWSLDLGSTTPTGDVVVTASATCSMGVEASTINGAEQGAPEVTQTGEDTDGTIDTSITTVTADSLISDVSSCNLNIVPSVRYAPTQVEDSAFSVAGSGLSFGTSSFDAGAAGSKTLGWNQSSTRQVHALVSYAPVTVVNTIATIDTSVVDGEQNNAFTTSGFASGDVNSFTIKTAGSEYTVDLSASLSGSAGSYTWDQQDIAAIVSAAGTAGLPFDTASWGSKIVTASNGTESDTDTVVINPKTNWNVREVNTPLTTNGYVGNVANGWQWGPAANTDQYYFYSEETVDTGAANYFNISAAGLMTFNLTTGSVPFLWWDATNGLWYYDAIDVGVDSEGNIILTIRACVQAPITNIIRDILR